MSLISISVKAASKNTGMKTANTLPDTSVSGVGKVAVKTWAHDKKSAFSFTFDDSFMSQYTYALPILDKYGFKATFFVISGAVTDGSPQDWRYGYWWQFKEMAAEGHEIGAHTMTHPDLTTLKAGDINTPNTIEYELYQSKKLIEENIPGYKCISLAYPYCSYDSVVEKVSSEYFQAARTCGDYVVPPSISGMKWYAINSQESSFNLPRNSTADDEPEFISYTENVRKKSITSGGWSVYFAHEVIPMSQISAGADTTMWYPVSTYWLDQLCGWVKQESDSGNVWEATFGNVVRYMKERENFHYSVASAIAGRMEISTSTGLDTSIYNYPLTVDISVPSDWKNVTIVQGTKDTVEVPSFNGTSYFVRTDITPGGPNVLLIKGSLYAVSGKITYAGSTGIPVASVKIDLFEGQNIIDSAETDNNGYYKFNDLFPGSYTVTLSKTGGWSGVNSTDALTVIKYFNGLTGLDSLQLKAADVNKDGKINSTDALIISRRFVGDINKFTVPDWIFSNPGTIKVNSSDVTLNINAVLAGDVNKSYR